MTITLALATSTPTSMTVVETSTSMSPRLNWAIVTSLSSALRRPCSRPRRRPFSAPVRSSSYISVAERSLGFSVKSFSVLTDLRDLAGVDFPDRVAEGPGLKPRRLEWLCCRGLKPAATPGSAEAPESDAESSGSS